MLHLKLKHRLPNHIVLDLRDKDDRFSLLSLKQGYDELSLTHLPNTFQPKKHLLPIQLSHLLELMYPIFPFRRIFRIKRMYLQICLLLEFEPTQHRMLVAPAKIVLICPHIIRFKHRKGLACCQRGVEV